MLTLRVLVNTMIASTTRYTPNVRPWAETAICVCGEIGWFKAHARFWNAHEPGLSINSKCHFWIGKNKACKAEGPLGVQTINFEICHILVTCAKHWPAGDDMCGKIFVPKAETPTLLTPPKNA